MRRVSHLTGSCWTPPGHLPTSPSPNFLRKGQPGVGASPGVTVGGQALEEAWGGLPLAFLLLHCTAEWHLTSFPPVLKAPGPGKKTEAAVGRVGASEGRGSQVALRFSGPLFQGLGPGRAWRVCSALPLTGSRLVSHAEPHSSHHSAPGLVFLHISSQGWGTSQPLATIPYC